jgi:hypothetical protein
MDRIKILKVDICDNNEFMIDFSISLDKDTIPQKYVDEMKNIDLDNFRFYAFDIRVYYDHEYKLYRIVGLTYVDNDGNNHELDYELTEDEKNNIIQMCKNKKEEVGA